MLDRKLSRRDVLGASAVLAAGAIVAEPLKAAQPQPSGLGPSLLEAARKEGVVAFYTAMEIPAAEDLGRAFEAKYPGIAVNVKRSGAERVFQRIGKEEGINLYEVDVACTTDAAHFIRWKHDGLLAPYLPEDVAKHLPTDQVDTHGMYATVFALLSTSVTIPIWLSPRMRPRVSPICLIQFGRARSSRAARTIAAPS